MADLVLGETMSDTGMKRALITVNINDVLDQNSRESFQDVARRWDAEWVEVTQGYAGWKPSIMKLVAFDLCDADRIFYVDADAVIWRGCPNPFEVFPDDDFVAVRNQQSHVPEVSRQACAETFRREIAAIAGPSAIFDGDFINAGVWLASRVEHQSILDHAAVITRGFQNSLAWAEQTPLNYSLALSGAKISLAADAWNYQFPPDTGPGRMAEYVYHWAGGENRHQIPKVNWRA